MTKKKSHNVLVPMVGAAGALCRLVCDSNLPGEHPAQLDKRISALLECGLYGQGQQALAAARALNLPKSGLLNEQRKALSVLNPGDITGLASENARSAELGLALVWLNGLCEGRWDLIAATGMLDTLSDSRVRVLPIHHLHQKLNLLAQTLRQPGASSRPSHLFLPIKDPEGQNSLQKHDSQLTELRKLGVKIHAIETLRDACDILGLKRYARTELEERLRKRITTALPIALCTVAASIYLFRPLLIEFGSGTSQDGKSYSTPARAQVTSNGGVSISSSCFVQPGSPWNIYSNGDKMAVRIKPPNDTLPIYGILVTYSDQSGLKVLPLPNPRLDRIEESNFIIDLDRIENENFIAVVARRLIPFQINEVQEELLELIGPLHSAERFVAARNWVNEHGSGRVEHLFKVVAEGDCR